MARARIDVSRLGPGAQRQIREKLLAEGVPAPKRANKFGAVRTEFTSIQGFRRLYDSRGEAHYAAELDLKILAKVVRWWLPQVPFPLPGGAKYVADFLVMMMDGAMEVIDYKGVDTKMSKMKRRQVFQLFSVDVQIARRPK